MTYLLELLEAIKTIKDTPLQVEVGSMFWKIAKEETLHTAFAKEIAKAKYKSTTTMRNIDTIKKMLA